MLEPPPTFISPDALLSLPTRLHNLIGQIFSCVNSRVVSSSCQDVALAREQNVLQPAQHGFFYGIQSRLRSL